MKPFDLELAKAGHPVQTRDGRPARIICYDRKDEEYPIVALIEDVDCGAEDTEEYTINGKYDTQVLRSDYDLFMAPNEKGGWVNIYKNPVGVYYCGNIYPSEEEATNHIGEFVGKHIATKKIEWEE